MQFVNKFLITIICLFFMFSCGEKHPSKLVFFEVTKSHYQKFLNQKPMPLNPNLKVDKVIHDDEYPVEISLYEDGQFYYHLENLGSGKGKWSYEEGVIHLEAKRMIFHKMRDMVYKFSITKEDGSEAILEFRDRFGKNLSSVKFRNIL